MPVVTITRPAGNPPEEWGATKRFIRDLVAESLSRYMPEATLPEEITLTTHQAEPDDLMAYQIEIHVLITWPGATQLQLADTASWIRGGITPYMRRHDLTCCVDITPRAMCGFAEVEVPQQRVFQAIDGEADGGTRIAGPMDYDPRESNRVREQFGLDNTARGTMDQSRFGGLPDFSGVPVTNPDDRPQVRDDGTIMGTVHLPQGFDPGERTVVPQYFGD